MWAPAAARPVRTSAARAWASLPGTRWWCSCIAMCGSSPDQVGDPRMLIAGSPHEALDSEPVEDIARQEGRERLIRDPAHGLAHEPAERCAVIAVSLTRRPHRLLSCHRGSHHVPVEDRARWDVVDDRDASLMAQRLPDCGIDSQLRPVVTERGIEVDEAPVDEDGEAQRRQSLSSPTGSRRACPAPMLVLSGRRQLHRRGQRQDAHRRRLRRLRQPRGPPRSCPRTPPGLF